MLYFTVAEELIPKLQDIVLFTLPSPFLRQKESLLMASMHIWECAGLQLKPTRFWVSSKACGNCYLATLPWSLGKEFCQGCVLPFREASSLKRHRVSLEMSSESWGLK